MKFHNKTLKTLSISLLLLTSLLSACQPSSGENASPQGTVQVTVSIPPQAYFVKRISGDSIAVNVMVEPGEEAHTYEPKPEQMKSLAESRIFFTIGLEYEASWVPRFKDNNPDLRIVDSTQGVQRIPLSSDDAHHDDESDEEHTDQGLDPHVWLSPQNGRIIADNILRALSDLLPESAGTFQQNYQSLIEDIDAVDNQIKETLSGLDQRKFMVFHPAWGYFAAYYNLEQLPVQVGGQDPSASELASLINIAQEEKIRVIFIQPNFNTASAEAIAREIGAEVAIVDPLGEDWIANLENTAEAFASALED